MTKCKISLLSLALLMLLCGVAQAQTTCFGAQGGTVVPGLLTYYSSTTANAASHLYVSNVSGSNVTCKVTVFDKDGNDVTASYSQVFSGGTNVSTGTGTFDLPAGSTRMYRFKTSQGGGSIYAYALIEWKSDDPRLRKALVAMHYRQQAIGSSYQMSDTSVNGGMPF
ncbi:hypothetical protein [Pseudodesulfovibrio sp. zrk46]|uniref:hypothetical protein n=1 Tax=Pseudodesulfovibrio sp. zrk46 TaxID=2725288 RepID=UPI0014492717|nr:hypothetical protein [Pseudodesulfovibrio sp. zrk46]QJB56149.1 hypothetical protein HFN16_06865 [Pseudodesulfovibrio sp. zrk46]